MKKNFTFNLMLLLCILLVGMSSVWAQNTYKLVTNVSQLSDGDEIIIASAKEAGSCYAIGAANNGNNRKAASVEAVGTGTNITITTDVGNESVTTSNMNTSNTITTPLEIILVASNTKWNLKEVISNDGIIYLNGGWNKSGNKNYLNVAAEVATGTNASNGVWSIEINTTTYVATITNGNNFVIKYNSSNSPKIFASYSSGQNPVYIYKKQVSSSYSVTISDPINYGSIKASPTSAAENATITLTPTPDPNYKLTSWSITQTTGGSATGITPTGPNDQGNYTFSMPAYNVTVGATFSQTYAIDCATGLANGSIASNLSEAASGETVTITATPTSGYKLKTVTVTETGGSNTVTPSVSSNTATFTMPAYGVTVSAEFEVAYTVTYEANGATSGTVPTDATQYSSGATVTVKSNSGSLAKIGHDFGGWNTKATGDGTNYTAGTGTFSIAGNTTLYAKWNVHTHSVTMPGADTYGSYTASATSSVAYGTTVTLTYTPEEGFEDYIAVWSSSQVTITDNQFTMPDENVTITVTIIPDNQVTCDFSFATIGTSYTSSYNNITNPEVDYEVVTAKITNFSKQTGTITNIPVVKAAGVVEVKTKNNATMSSVTFNCAQWTTKTQTITLSYSTNGGSSYSAFDPAVTSTNFTITKDNLPSGTNAVKLTFSQDNQVGVSSAVVTLNKKNITIDDDIANGTVSASKSSIIPGRTVSLTATPATGCVLDSWDVYYMVDETKHSVDVTNNQFTMPGYDVTVSASFRAPITFTVQFSINGSIDGGITISNINEGSSIDLPTGITCSATSLAFKGWSSSETDVASVLTGSYTPTDDVTLYAVFGKSDLIYSFTISGSDFVTGGYDDNNGEKTSTATTSGSETMPVKWTSNHIMLNSTNMQWYKSDDAYIYNSTELGTIQSVTMSSSDDKFTTYYGDTENPSSNTVVGNKYFKIVNTSSSTVYIASITISFKKSYNYTRFIDVTDAVNLGGNVPAAHIYTIKDGGTLTITGNLGDENNLIVEDGGQLICSTSVAATIKKDIAGCGSAANAKGWYLISSPIDNPTIDSDAVSNLLTTSGDDNTYDLYRYNESNYLWENYRNGDYASTFTSFENGRGYLYRNVNNVTVTFAGSTNATASYTLSNKNSTSDIKGFNIIGNPYTHKIYKNGENTAINTSNLCEGYYRLSTEGGWDYQTTAAINPGEGVLVKVSTGGETVTLPIANTDYAGSASKYNRENIRFEVANNLYEDAACAMFAKGYGLNKINHRNAEIPMIYIPQNGENYAIAMMSDDTKSFELNFKAMTTGQYTLKYKANGDFNYIHVIDRFTGEDVDMLLDGEYSFIGSPADSDARFIVKLGYMPDYSDDANDIFAFQNGSEILVSGEGELQIFDVTGRKVMTTTINGVETINGLNNGVYIFNLEGKTQKIVVR